MLPRYCSLSELQGKERRNTSYRIMWGLLYSRRTSVPHTSCKTMRIQTVRTIVSHCSYSFIRWMAKQIWEDKDWDIHASWPESTICPNFFFYFLLLSFNYSCARESTAKNATFWKKHLHKHILFHRKSLRRPSMVFCASVRLNFMMVNAEPLADVIFLFGLPR